MLAGFAAHQGHLHVLRALLACAIGSWLADVALYSLGLSRAAGLLRRSQWLASSTERLLRAVQRHPGRASLATRFAYGARLILPVTCGAARIQPGQFLLGSGASALVWSCIFTGLGWIFGRTAVELVGRMRSHEDLVGGALVVLVTGAMLVVTKRNAKHVPEEILGRERAHPEASAGAGDATSQERES